MGINLVVCCLPTNRHARELEKAAAKASDRREKQKRAMRDKALALKKKQEDSDQQVCVVLQLQG